MPYKLHKSGVITGSLNSFCLACDSLLKSQLEADEHIRTSEHMKKSAAVPYSDKFKDEHIKKFKWGYYCEFCNVLLPIASKVNIHITEEEHKHNRGILLLKPMGADVVAFNNVLIGEKAWHGLIDGVCSLCNAEFDDEDEHTSDAKHSLNLVLKPVQFGADGAIYRPLDDTATQCLTCNKLVAPCKMIQHFEDAEHHDLYGKCRIETNGVCQANETEENSQENEDKGGCQDKTTNITSITENSGEPIKIKVVNDDNNNEKPNKSKILESIVKYQTKGISINLETETVSCKKCSQVIKFDLKEIERHIENHSSAVTVDSDLLYPSNVNQNLNRVDINDKTTQAADDETEAEGLNETRKALQAEDQAEAEDQGSSSPEDDDTNAEKVETKAFANANKITYNENNNQSYCRICRVHLPSSLRSMKEHVEGANHKRVAGGACHYSTQSNNPGRQVKQATKDFVDSSYTIESLFDTVCVINEEYCVPQKGFYLISGDHPRLRCLLCECNLPPFISVVEHCRQVQHLIKWQKVPVIISEKSEIIREIRPGVFHCAYCNLAVSGWNDMKLHLECSDHRENRILGERKLRVHIPNIQRHKMQEQLEAMAMMRFLNMF